MRPFRIDVPEQVLADLRERLSRSRFTTATDSTRWKAGADPSDLRALVEYWAGGFDWRGVEARLNEYPQYVAEIEGQRVHFVHLRSPRPGALPLVLTHGWPSCFAEMLALAGRLVADFDVVVPSLPGFAFSEAPRGPFTGRAVAGTWQHLMTTTLGYERYGAFGGDIGGSVTQWLGALYPASVAGIHMTSGSLTSGVDPAVLDAAGLAYLDAQGAYDAQDGGYSEIMRTRPDTIAAALADSPAGLLAWIADKYRDWSDCGGDLASRWGADDLLTVATIYWATGTIGTSFRAYYDHPHSGPRPPITVPTGITLSHEPLMEGFPESLARRAFPGLSHFTRPASGGHFMAHEEPDYLAGQLRTFFGPLT
ncbi:epoxide hydrolase family protein [Longispora albida]|uniref:epoxide hydrolase family protein n=1 Tax=Longispora albida TaxID=203523 RepID=UPI000381D812|nr:epoxide hydrolase family protein [Longispora albida]